ncbi:MAG TPA: M67 family metallopeptidase [Pyrinomonadaceae bacterium]|nr:M67 family metallopeptidase [Pyrinomonadaceae bacterium]
MIELNRELIDQIGMHGEQEYPNECCGLLIGRFADGTKTVIEVQPISNARETVAKHNRFLIRPEDLMRGERYARSKELDVIGFYHSHPDHPAIPSQYDLEHAWPVYSYIVLAVHGGRSQDMRSWELRPDRAAFEEEGIQKGETLCLSPS